MKEVENMDYKVEGSFLILKLFQVGQHFSTHEAALEYDT